MQSVDQAVKLLVEAQTCIVSSESLDWFCSSGVWLNREKERNWFSYERNLSCAMIVYRDSKDSNSNSFKNKVFIFRFSKLKPVISDCVLPNIPGALAGQCIDVSTKTTILSFAVHNFFAAVCSNSLLALYRTKSHMTKVKLYVSSIGRHPGYRVWVPGTWRHSGYLVPGGTLGT